MIRPRRTIYPLVALLGGQLAFSGACAGALSWRFGFGNRVPLLHVAIVAALMVLAVASLALAIRQRWIPNRFTARLLACALGAAGTMSLSLLYVGDFFASRAWDGNINYRIVWQYGALMLPNRPPFYISGWLHAAIVAAGLLILALYWRCSNLLVASVEELVASTKSDGPRPSREWQFTVLAAGGSIGFAIVIGLLGWTVNRRGLLDREPIAGFLIVTDSLTDFSQYTLDVRLPGHEARARAEYPRGQRFQRRNVVIIMVDSLRADHMSVYGYERDTTPFLDRLLESGRLRKVQLALSTCAESNCGILSTMTSKSLRRITANGFSLSDLLHDQGYSVYQILSGNHDWQGLRAAYGFDQTLYFDSESTHEYAVNDDRVLFEGLDRVPDYTSRPALIVFHLMSAHSAGVKQERYRRYAPSNIAWDWTSLTQASVDAQTLTNSYDNGVLQADAVIEELFERLREKGYLANSVVAVLADHGEGLGEHHEYGHTFSLHQEFIRIPLLIYDDPEAPYRNLTFATQVDVAPTIVDRLGLRIPASWEGRSLLDPAVKEYSYHQTRKRRPCYAVVYRSASATYKYMRCATDSEEQLYDLNVDPSEQHNLIATTPPPLLERLRQKLLDTILEPALH